MRSARIAVLQTSLCVEALECSRCLRIAVSEPSISLGSRRFAIVFSQGELLLARPDQLVGNYCTSLEMAGASIVSNVIGMAAALDDKIEFLPN